MKYIEENLITHINSRECHISDFTFASEKAEGYTVKYLGEQKDELWTDFEAKYPYFRLRGLPVSKETALDIISKTDYRFQEITELDTDIQSALNDNLFNNWTNNTGIRGNYPFGWCHPDGTIGYNSFTTKYPDYAELMNEIINIKLDFQFLEFMVAFTNWNSEAPYVGDLVCEIREKISEEEAEIWEAKEDYFNFAENIRMLVYVHDKTFEIYWDKEATSIYKELLPKLQDKPDLKYVNRYYEMFWMKEENIEPRIRAMLNEEQINIVNRHPDSLLNYAFEGCLITEEQMEKYRMYYVDACYGHLKRRPYFRIIGKPVTPEQAKEFICRTDDIIRELFYECKWDKRLKRFYNPKQRDNHIELNMIDISNYATNRTIIRPDGVIDCGCISKVKYPDRKSFIHDMQTIAENFHYLDFVAILTCWDEESPFDWDRDDYIEDIEAGRRTEEEVIAIAEVETDITRAIHDCFWIHDGKAECLRRKDAIAKYNEYMSLYHKEGDYKSSGQCMLDMGLTKEEYFKDILDFYEIPFETLKIFRYKSHF